MKDNYIIDVSSYIQLYMQVKATNKFNEEELYNIFNKLFSNKYNTVCMDIDKTLLDDKKIDNEMFDIIFEILKQNKNICFVTGRGRKTSKSTLNELYKESIVRGVDIKNITCCTGNGTVYMYSKNGFLDSEESIIAKEKINKYQLDKTLLRDLYIKELEKNNMLKENLDVIKNDSIKNSGKTSLRFPINIDVINKEKVEELLQMLNNVLLKRDLLDEYYINKSTFMDKIIFEISLSNKKKAIDFLSNKLEENRSDIIRIGDQGKKHGNDFSMLNCFQGFSVDEIESSTKGVLPIMGEDGKKVKGIDATKKVLKDLILDTR